MHTKLAHTPAMSLDTRLFAPSSPLMPSQVRKDWRALKSSVGVLEHSGPEQEHAELAAASKQLQASLATVQKVLDLDSGAADAFHANVVALAEATQTAHDQLRVNVVRRDIEATRVRPLHPPHSALCKQRAAQLGLLPFALSSLSSTQHSPRRRSRGLCCVNNTPLAVTPRQTHTHQHHHTSGLILCGPAGALLPHLTAVLH